MRAFAAAVLVSALLLSPSSATAGGKAEHGSFTATAYPFPQILAGGCRAGIDGFSYESFSFTAPSDGILYVLTDEFEGDWDLSVYDAKSGTEIRHAYQGGWRLSPGSHPREKVNMSLREGREVLITPCNSLSEQFELKVKYVFRPARGTKS